MQVISYEELVAELKKVTLNDVIKAGREVFLGNGISMIALGPIGEEEIDKGCIEFS